MKHIGRLDSRDKAFWICSLAPTWRRKKLVTSNSDADGASYPHHVCVYVTNPFNSTESFGEKKFRKK